MQQKKKRNSVKMSFRKDKKKTVKIGKSDRKKLRLKKEKEKNNSKENKKTTQN